MGSARPSLAYRVSPGQLPGCPSAPAVRFSSAETTFQSELRATSSSYLPPWCLLCVRANKCLFFFVHLFLSASPAEHLEGYRKNGFFPACVTWVLPPGQVSSLGRDGNPELFPFPSGDGTNHHDALGKRDMCVTELGDAVGSQGCPSPQGTERLPELENLTGQAGATPYTRDEASKPVMSSL